VCRTIVHEHQLWALAPRSGLSPHALGFRPTLWILGIGSDGLGIGSELALRSWKLTLLDTASNYGFRRGGPVLRLMQRDELKTQVESHYGLCCEIRLRRECKEADVGDSLVALPMHANRFVAA